MESSKRFIKELKSDYDKYDNYCTLCTKHKITEAILRKIIKLQGWERKKLSKILREIVDKKIKVDDIFLKPIKKTNKNIINDIKKDIKDEIKQENKDEIIDKVVTELKKEIINKPKRIRKKKQDEPDDKPIKTCKVAIDDVKNISKLSNKINKECKK